MSGTANARADVYAIPADWASRPLGELATVGAGGTPSREVQAYWNGAIPWITTSQIDFNRIKAAEQFITKEGLRNSSAKLVPPGTLLLALYGQGKTRGKVGILDIEAATNQACASIVPYASVSGDFLFHFLANRYEAIRNASNSGGQENLSSSIVKSIEVHVPEIREQQAIADVLSDVDFLLASLDELVAKKRDLKQAAMQQLLTGRVRLAGHGREWKQASLGDFFTFKNGLNKAKEFFGFGTPIVNYMDVYNGPKIRASHVEGRVSLSVDEIKNFDVRRGDVLFTRTSETPEEVGMAAVMLDEPTKQYSVASFCVPAPGMTNCLTNSRPIASDLHSSEIKSSRSRPIPRGH